MRPPLRVWAKSRSIIAVRENPGHYVATWKKAGIVVRVDDLIAPNGLNLYKQFWNAMRQWKAASAYEPYGMYNAYQRVLELIETETGIAPGHNRKTVVPLAWFGVLVQVLHQHYSALDLHGTEPNKVLTDAIIESLSYWHPKFKYPLLFLRTTQIVHEKVDAKPEAEVVQQLNETVELPPPNATDMLMQPLVRKYFPIKGSATLNFCMTFNTPRPQLVQACIGANKLLRQQNATLVLPDTQIGGPGNRVMLLIDIPELCDSFPLVGGYPRASDHDMTYEAIRRAEQLVQDTYQMLSKIVCPELEEHTLLEAGDAL